MAEYLVRANDRDPEYLEIAQDLRGYSWTPYQSRAHRFTDRADAEKAAEGLDATVVRLKSKNERVKRTMPFRECDLLAAAEWMKESGTEEVCHEEDLDAVTESLAQAFFRHASQQPSDAGPKR